MDAVGKENSISCYRVSHVFAPRFKEQEKNGRTGQHPLKRSGENEEKTFDRVRVVSVHREYASAWSRIH
jgi:hypothetical protein